jgi:hypothetical protein
LQRDRSDRGNEQSNEPESGENTRIHNTTDTNLQSIGY